MYYDVLNDSEDGEDRLGNWNAWDSAENGNKTQEELEDEADEEFIRQHEDFTDKFYLFFEPDGDGNMYDDDVLVYDDEGSVLERLESLEPRDLDHARVIVGQEMHISKNKITLGM